MQDQDNEKFSENFNIKGGTCTYGALPMMPGIKTAANANSEAMRLVAKPLKRMPENWGFCYWSCRSAYAPDLPN